MEGGAGRDPSQKNKKKSNKFRDASSSLPAKSAATSPAAAAVQEEGVKEPPAKKQATLAAKAAPAAWPAHESSVGGGGGAPQQQGSKQSGAVGAGSKKEGFVKMKLEFPAPHTWMFQRQPTLTAYGGLGFAKPSVWLPLPAERNGAEMSEFIDQFSDVFDQHVEYGSTGKAFVKGFKREREANMLWRVKLRAKLEEEGGSSGGGIKKKTKRKKDKKKKGKKEGGEAADEDGEAEEGGGAGGVALAEGKKERVKKRRAIAKSVQSRSMPKIAVDTLLQMSAIEAYRRMKEAKKAPQTIERVQPGPGSRPGGGGGHQMGGWGVRGGKF